MIKNLIWIVLLFFTFTSFAQNKIAQKIEESYNLGDKFYTEFEEGGDKYLGLFGFKGCQGPRKLFLFKQNQEILDFEQSFNLVQSIPFFSENVRLADINGDGVKELLVGIHEFRFDIYVFQDGKLKFLKEIASGAINKTSVVSDVDNDGRDDILAITSFFSDDVAKFSFNDDFDIITETNYIPILYQYLEKLIDLDGNGTIDLLSSQDENISITLMENGEISEVIDTTSSFEILSGFYDLNQNGEVDIPFRKPSVDSLFLAVDFAKNLFSKSFAISDRYTSPISYIDLDEDGTLELQVYWQNSGNKVVKLVDDELEFIDITLENPTFIIPEKILHSYYNNGVYKQVLRGESEILEYSKINNHFIGKELVFEIEDLRYLKNVQYADIDQDNILDKLIAFRMLDGDFLGYKKGTSSGFLNHTIKLTNKLPQLIFKGLADFNNDGLIDLLYSSYTYELFISYGEPNGVFSESEPLSKTVPFFDKVLIDDFDNNGWKDIFALTDDPFMIYSSPEGFTVDSTSFSFDFSHAEKTNVPGAIGNIIGRKFDEIGLQRIYENGTTDFTLLDDELLVESRYLDEFDFNGDKVHEILIEDRTKEDSIAYLVAKLSDDYTQLEVMARSPYLPLEFFKFAEVLIHDYDEDNYYDLILAIRDNDDKVEFYNLKNIEDSSFENKGRIENFYNINITSQSSLDFTYRLNQNSSNTNINYFHCSEYYEVSGNNGSQIRGLVFLDKNENGSMDSDEAPVANTKIRFSSETTNRTIVSNEDGSYAVALENDQYNISVESENCHNSYENTISHDNTISNFDIGLKSNGQSSGLKINLTTGPTRCGFDVPYWLRVENNSCDPLDGTLTISFDDLSPDFDIFDGSFTKTDNGYIIEIDNLLPGGVLKYKFLVQMPDFNFVGETILDEIKIENEAGNLIIKEDVKNIIRCAIDPNDKLIKPDRTSEFDEQYVTHEEINYTIRFQNVGNDTAINIVVVDSISPFLDFNSIKIEASSHTNRVEFDEYNRTIIFNFEDIHLVDSITNESGSHGFVSFTIRPLTNLNDNIEIENKAGIYFDFNPPIITNNLKSIFLNDLSILNSTENSDKNYFAINPNPTLNSISISFPLSGDPPNVCLYDITGRKIKNLNLDTNNSCSLEGLPSGLYLLQISANEKKETIKLVKL